MGEGVEGTKLKGEDAFNVIAVISNPTGTNQLEFVVRRNGVKRQATSSSPRTGDGLGTVWNVNESGYRGEWTRQGTSSSFKAVWGTTTADLTITRSGNSVTVSRTNSSDGNDCTYTGTIQADCKTVSGTYHCKRHTPKEGATWSATIR
jgi:hypothetical protein